MDVFIVGHDFTYAPHSYRCFEAAHCIHSQNLDARDETATEAVADSRIRRLPASWVTFNAARTPNGSVMFRHETWPDRIPYATGTPRSPITRSTASSKV